MAAEHAEHPVEPSPDGSGPAATAPTDPSVADDPSGPPAAPPRPRARASVWVAAAVALLAALVMAWVTSLVGDPLRAECLREAAAATCERRTGWLDDALALQSALALVAVALLVLTGLRRTRFVRRTSLLVLVLAVGSFFGAVLMASGGLPQDLLG